MKKRILIFKLLQVENLELLSRTAVLYIAPGDVLVETCTDISLCNWWRQTVSLKSRTLQTGYHHNLYLAFVASLGAAQF